MDYYVDFTGSGNKLFIQYTASNGPLQKLLCRSLLNAGFVVIGHVAAKTLPVANTNADLKHN